MPNLTKHTFESDALKGVSCVERGNVYRQCPRKWIESRSIIGNLDPLARIGIEAVGGVA